MGNASKGKRVVEAVADLPRCLGSNHCSSQVSLLLFYGFSTLYATGVLQKLWKTMAYAIGFSEVR